jgi:V4R domain
MPKNCTRKDEHANRIKPTNFPLDIAQFAFGQRVGEAIVTAQNRSSVLRTLMQTMEECGFNPFKIYGGSSLSNGPQANYLIFFEAANSRHSINSLRRKLAGLDSVIHVSVSGNDDLFVDTKSIPLLQMGRRSLIIDDDLLGEVLNSVSKLGPTGMASLRWGAIQAAIRNVKWIESTPFGLSHSPRVMFTKMIDLSQSAGWGVFKTQFRRNGTPEQVRVRDSFEALARGQTKNGFGCALLEGYLTGLAGKIFNPPIRLVEQQCVSLGNEACLFINDSAI